MSGYSPRHSTCNENHHLVLSLAKGEATARCGTAFALTRVERSRHLLNLGPQTTTALQKFLGARCKCAVHPIARPALFHSEKTNALHFELLSNQLVQINAVCNYVAPGQSRLAGLNLRRAAKLIENFHRKESDLTFIIVLEIEVSITANTTPRHTFYFRYFNHRMRVRFAPVMANKIVSPGNEQVTNFHRTHATIEAS